MPVWFFAADVIYISLKADLFLIKTGCEKGIFYPMLCHFGGGSVVSCKGEGIFAFSGSFFVFYFIKI